MAKGHLALRLYRGLRARPRLLGSMAFGVLVFVLARTFSPWRDAGCALVAWNAGALLYLALAWEWMRETDVKAIQQRAIGQDEGRIAILSVVVLAAAAMLVAVGTQLGQARDLHGSARVLHVSFAVLTIVTSWLFTQVVFALHYAHDFYLLRLRGQKDPLDFPGTPDPSYFDFFHFACIIGTSSQTADITFMGQALRPVGTLHCVVAFFFNASLIALSINVVAGLL
ncbi:DUF1345 domain-containing protein [Ramlibacter sp. G-1-2-2]|uniref:DUF1345 domain-containing protein n=1 Tax=Ramlibacter agri TaxID=2728837 RepID=A0A848H297_9BURK|nr:DUF1345 domain-containing protein [Ramlibacter agri]NML44694.1 DUF1345 domain-containing protein [Ramlibacter agri]